METVSALLAICAGNSPVPGEFPHKGQWRGALMFSLIWARINGWVNNPEAGDLRRHPTHCDVIVMLYDECNHSSMLRLKLNHVTKGAPVGNIDSRIKNNKTMIRNMVQTRHPYISSCSWSFKVIGFSLWFGICIISYICIYHVPFFYDSLLWFLLMISSCGLMSYVNNDAVNSIWSLSKRKNISMFLWSIFYVVRPFCYPFPLVYKLCWQLPPWLPVTQVIHAGHGFAVVTLKNHYVLGFFSGGSE